MYVEFSLETLRGNKEEKWKLKHGICMFGRNNLFSLQTLYAPEIYNVYLLYAL